MKRCKKCGIEKPETLEFFQAHPNSSGGLNARCKTCLSAAKKLHYEQNKTAIRARQKEYYDRNTEKFRDSNRAWVEANPEKARAIRRKYYENNKAACIDRAANHKAAKKKTIADAQLQWELENPIEAARVGEEKRLAIKRRQENTLQRARERNRARAAERAEENRARVKAWAAANPERVREQNRRKRAKDKRPRILQSYAEYQTKRQTIKQNRRARENTLPNTLTSEQWEYALKYFGGRCAVCGTLPDSVKGRTIALDHWFPIAGDIKLGTVVENVLPLCHGLGGCNNSKGNKNPDEWLLTRFGRSKASAISQWIDSYFYALPTVW